MSKQIQGILCRSDRKFYYLETGNSSTRNSIDRLRSVLLRRGLITYHRKDANDFTPPYKLMTLEEAQERGLEIEVLYINKHIEKIVKEEQAKTNRKANPWGN